MLCQIASGRQFQNFTFWCCFLILRRARTAKVAVFWRIEFLKIYLIGSKKCKITPPYSTVYTIQYVADCLLRRVHAYLPHFYTAADSVHFEQIRIRPLKKM